MTGQPSAPSRTRSTYDVVVPTIGRPSLTRLLRSLAAELGDPRAGPAPGAVIVVDDRPAPTGRLELGPVDLPVRVTTCGGRGPAAGRNRGWRQSRASWICFLDDDVEIRPGWSRLLAHDLASCDDGVAAVQGRVEVPVPGDRRMTDRERNVAGLATAAWITADMAIRRTALTEVGGFDERFPRAYREDADLALRLLDAGWRLTVGARRVIHPVGPARWTVSVTQQRGNADDALMRRLHGSDWRRRAGAPSGDLRDHIAATATAVAALAVMAARRDGAARALIAAWLLQWARLSVRRIVGGPRTPREIAAMTATSAVLPPSAVHWMLRGRLRARRLAAAATADRWGTRRPQAVLFDRDGTLVDDVAYNGDPDRVRPVDGAGEALDRLRAAGVRVGLVSNQSGVARGLISEHDVVAVNRRVAELLGPLDTVRWCPHGPDDGCTCRKPATGMLRAAAAELGVAPTCCAFVGDIGTDVEAGLGCGMRTVLVPTEVTRPEEVLDAPEVAVSVTAAVDALLGSRRLPAGHRWRPGSALVGEQAG